MKRRTAFYVWRAASLGFGIAIGACKRDPAADLAGALTSAKSTARPAIITDPVEFGQLLRDIRRYDGTAAVRLALEMLALVFVRPGEVRKMEWTEIDLENATWTIPADKMKMRLQHQVPLSPQAVTILETMRPITGGGRYVFGMNGVSKPLSDATLGKALRTMGYDTRTEHCAQGFRSSASTLLNEERRPTGDPAWHPDVVELSLAHVDDNSVRAIYNRAKLWPDRVRLMQHWADRIAAMRDGAMVLRMKKPANRRALA